MTTEDGGERLGQLGYSAVRVPAQQRLDSSGVAAPRLAHARPAAAYPSILLPTWFPLEQALLVTLGSDTGSDIWGFCSWWPGDGLTGGDLHPQWEFASPSCEEYGFDADDPRVCACDASMDQLRHHARRIYRAPVTLIPRTFEMQWEPYRTTHRGQWAQLPCFLVQEARA